MATIGYQHGPKLDYVEVMTRMHEVAAHMPDGPVAPGIVVELCTMDPYTVIDAVVTAVGFKDGDVLLTVEPVDQPTEAERLAIMMEVLEGEGFCTLEVDLSCPEMAARLLDRGVLPTRR